MERSSNIPEAQYGSSSTMTVPRRESGGGPISNLSSLNENPFMDVMNLQDEHSYDKRYLEIKLDELKALYKNRAKEMKYRTNIPHDARDHESKILNYQYKIAKERIKTLYKFS